MNQSGAVLGSSSVRQLHSSTSTGIKALDLAPVFTTVLGLAFTNFTPVWLPGRGKALQHGAALGRTSPVDSILMTALKNHRGSPPDMLATDTI